MSSSPRANRAAITKCNLEPLPVNGNADPFEERAGALFPQQDEITVSRRTVSGQGPREDIAHAPCRVGGRHCSEPSQIRQPFQSLGVFRSFLQDHDRCTGDHAKPFEPSERRAHPLETYCRVYNFAGEARHIREIQVLIITDRAETLSRNSFGGPWFRYMLSPS